MNILTLHVAVRILLSNSLLETLTNYAEELLNHFVACTKIIYGLHFITHNIYNLLHLVDTKKFGNLNKFSNFSSENFFTKIEENVKKIL